MKKIVVMMSTYNGEKYLRTQLDSVFSQKNVEVHMLVRDDGSSDSTLSILEEYSKKYQLKYYTGDNLKPAKSFMDLINKVDEYDYYAFCDQDDYWLDNKLITGIEKIGSVDVPTLYCCGMDVVDGNLNHVDYYLRKKQFASSFKYSSFFGSEIAGCTMIYNNNLMKYLKMYNPIFLPMHDTWVHKVCLAVNGRVIIDDDYLIKYRIHGNNVIGMRKRTIKEKTKNLFKRNHNFSRLNREILNGYINYMNADTLKFCKKFNRYWLNFVSLSFLRFGFRIGYKSRIKMIFKMIMRVY